MFIENAPCGITVTFLDNVRSVMSFVENAPAPKSVTVSGITSFFNWLELNALSPIFVTDAGNSTLLILL